MTNRFLFKVNGELHCPDGICHPGSGNDWEGKDVLIPATGPIHVAADGSRTPAKISENDEVWVWTHEHDDFGRGWGLTAKAHVAGLSECDTFLAVTLKDVEKLARPFGFKNLDASDVSLGVLKRMNNIRHHQAYLLDDTDFSGLMELVERYGGELPEDIRHPDESDWAREIRTNKGIILNDLAERRLMLQKSRPAQSGFRKELLALYGGKCAVTGCDVPEALEAAHVLPHNGDPIRDRADNGLLLRRDLHALFDAMLWSIDPDTNTISLAASLKRSAYRNLHGTSITHHVAPDPLRLHFTQSNKAPQYR